MDIKTKNETVLARKTPPAREVHWDTLEDYNRYACWEILSFKNRETGEIVNDIPNYELPGSEVHETNFTIESVKRTTDGKIFNIGDLLALGYSNEIWGQITLMYISHTQIRVVMNKMGLPLTNDLDVINR